MSPSIILYLSAFSEIGGGETSLLYLLSKLNKKKFTPIVVLPKEGQLSNQLRQAHITVYIIPFSPYSWRFLFLPGCTPSALLKLFRLCRTQRPKLIHLNHPILSLYGGLIGKLLKIPVITTAHGPWDIYYFFHDLMYQLMLRKIITNTLSLKSLFKKHHLVSKTKIIAIPFGIDTSYFKPGSQRKARQMLNLPQTKLIISFVSRLDPLKDLETSIDASRMVTKIIPKAHFYLIGSEMGDFSQTNYGQEILKKLPPNTTFMGFSTNMPLVYQASDMIVSSSLFESFGLTLAEAGACGIPVVCTNQGNQKAIVKTGYTGFLVPPKNPKALAQKIITLAKNKNLRRQFGFQARQHIQKHFELTNYVKKIEAIYDSFVISV